jgi:hypothetical protein
MRDTQQIGCGAVQARALLPLVLTSALTSRGETLDDVKEE